MAITLKYNCNTLMCVHNIRTSLSRPVHDIYYTVYKIQRGQRRIKINNIHVFYTLAKNSYSQYNPRSPTNNFFFFSFTFIFPGRNLIVYANPFFRQLKKEKKSFYVSPLNRRIVPFSHLQQIQVPVRQTTQSQGIPVCNIQYIIQWFRSL